MDWQNRSSSISTTTRTLPSSPASTAVTTGIRAWVRAVLGACAFIAACRDKSAGHAWLRVPGIVRGTLQPGDTMLADRSYCDEYRLHLTAGQIVTITVRAGASTSSPGRTIDPCAALLLDGRVLARDDDMVVVSPSSQIAFKAAQDGTYVLKVSTFGAGPVTGAYVVEVATGRVPLAW